MSWLRGRRSGGDEDSAGRAVRRAATGGDDENGGAADGVVIEVASDADTPIGESVGADEAVTDRESVESFVTAGESVTIVEPATAGRAVAAANPVTVVEPGPEPDPDRDPAALDAHRRALIDLVIYAYDRTTSTGIRARLAEGLRGVGVVEVVPDGEEFDAAHHEAGGVEPTDVPALYGCIAETERAGFVDGARVVREPIVVVYRPR